MWRWMFCLLINIIYLCRPKLILNRKMKYSCTKLYRAVLAFIGFVVLSSCVGDVCEEISRKPEPVQVGICLGGEKTRTSMLSNGLSAEWLAGDQIAVWAKNSAGAYQLSNQIFKLYGSDVKRGFFTSTLESAMPEDVYTYYCTYPSPISVNGTQATFSLPSVQDGKVTGGADIMVATPVQHGPLTAIPDPDDHSGMSMQMNRMIHQLRFYIPENNTVMESARIKKMELNFPSEVCGKVVVDMANPNQRVILSEARRNMTLNLAQPLTRSMESRNEYDYACVAIAPTKFSAGQSLAIRAFTEDKIAVIDPIDLCAKNFQSGHSTPVRLIVKELIDYPYLINFTLSGNNVGEPVTSIKFIAPSGCNWPTSGTNEYTYNPGRNISVGETYTFRFPDYDAYAKFSNATITIELETENTITAVTAGVGSIPSGVESYTAKISATVPYLLYQDFSSIPNFSDGHDNAGGGSDTWIGMNELSSYASALEGWHGARVGGKASTAIRICCRYQNVAKGAYYKGQLYAPALTRIKEGKSVKVNVSFKYGGGSNKDKAKPLMYFGINTLNPLTNPDETDLMGGVITGTGYGNQYPATLLPVFIEKKELARGSEYSCNETASITINDFDNFMRLTWFVTTTHTALFTNSNTWLYLDDIKVQIVK